MKKKRNCSISDQFYNKIMNRFEITKNKLIQNNVKVSMEYSSSFSGEWALLKN